MMTHLKYLVTQVKYIAYTAYNMYEKSSDTSGICGIYVYEISGDIQVKCNLILEP
jgi:hypothetical protein